MQKKSKNFLAIFSIFLVFLFSSILVFALPKTSAGFFSDLLSGLATYQEKTTPSNVTVNVWVEISLSSNLTAGILFGTVDPNTEDNNATGNYNGSSMTQYSVTAGSANNANIDLCIKDDVALTQGSYTIPNNGYTYNFSSSNTAALPALPGTAITTSYVKTQHTNIAANGVSYARFWLDIPLAQQPGTYSNTIYIKGIQTGQAC